MNIFFLDKNPKVCAQYHCDKHVVKMILESAQILSTVIRLHVGAPKEISFPDGDKKLIYALPNETFSFKKIAIAEYFGWRIVPSSGFYIQTHIKHPSVIWARKSEKNFIWLVDLLYDLHEEWQFRFNNKEFNTAFERFKQAYITNNTWDLLRGSFVSKEFSAPALAMPDEFKINSECLCEQHEILDALQSYRNYYNFGKTHLHKWTRREIPSWIVT